jgi:hypothetical protein
MNPDRKPRGRHCAADGKILTTRQEKEVGLCSPCIARRETEKKMERERRR